MGLEYLINISYVDDTEVFKVRVLLDLHMFFVPIQYFKQCPSPVTCRSAWIIGTP